MKRFILPIVIVVLLILTLVSLTANIHLAQSKTTTGTQFSRSSSSQSGVDHTIDVNRVFLHVENRVGIGSALGWAICEDLEQQGGFDVVLLNNDPGADDYPLLLVGIRNKKSFWTPFYAHASLQIVAKYASYTTDISLDESPPINFDGSEEQGNLPIRMTMTVDVTNTTTGLVTLPAHRRMLVQGPASEITQYVRKGIDEALEKSRGAAAANQNKPQ